MKTYAEVVEALVAAKGQKEKLDKEIKKLQREVLESKEAQSAVLPLSNQGGERTVQGVTYEIKRSYDWDSDLIGDALAILFADPDDEHPLPFLTSEYKFKVDMRKYKDWATMNPKEALVFANCLTTKLGEPTVKKIDLGKLKSTEEETS